MINRIACLVAFALTIVVVVLAGTSLPVLAGGHMEGRLLLMHMSASGVFVLLLPLYAVLGFRRLAAPGSARRLRRVGFWGVLIAGFLTVLTVFLCMLPVASTSQMHTLTAIHGYVGFAVVASIGLNIGDWLGR